MRDHLSTTDGIARYQSLVAEEKGTVLLGRFHIEKIKRPFQQYPAALHEIIKKRRKASSENIKRGQKRDRRHQCHQRLIP